MRPNWITITIIHHQPIVYMYIRRMWERDRPFTFAPSNVFRLLVEQREKGRRKKSSAIQLRLVLPFHEIVSHHQRYHLCGVRIQEKTKWVGFKSLMAKFRNEYSCYLKKKMYKKHYLIGHRLFIRIEVKSQQCRLFWMGNPCSLKPDLYVRTLPRSVHSFPTYRECLCWQ